MFVNLIKENLEKLSVGQSKVAKYLIDNFKTGSYMTIAQLSQENEVSETTVIRLAYSLGFKSFSEMQNMIRSEVLKSLETKQPEDSFEENSQSNDYIAILEDDIKTLRQIIGQLDTVELDKVVEKVVNADSVFSVGFRSSASAISWFSFMLSTLRPSVYKTTGISAEFNTLLNVTNHSIVFACTFSRYSSETISYMKLAKENGATIVAITDNALSPPALLADHVFIAKPNRTIDGFNSIASAVSIFNLIITGVIKHGGCESRIRMQEHIYNANRSVLE